MSTRIHTASAAAIVAAVWTDAKIDEYFAGYDGLTMSPPRLVLHDAAGDEAWVITGTPREILELVVRIQTIAIVETGVKT